MKLQEIYNELLEISKKIGISVRKEKGSFKSGYCVVHDKEMFILNKNTPVEIQTSIIAEGLAKYTDKIFIKPVVREFLEKENHNKIQTYNLDIIN